MNPSSPPSSVAEGVTPEPEHANPFLEMTPAHRGFLIAVAIAVYLAAWVFGEGRRSPGAEVAFFASLISTSMALLPVIFHRPRWGWLHPTTVMILFWLSGVVRRFSQISLGLTQHTALPEFHPSRLNNLNATHDVIWAVGHLIYFLVFLMEPNRTHAPRPFVADRRTMRQVGFAGSLLALMGVYLYMLIGHGGALAHFNATVSHRHLLLSGQHYFTNLPVLATTFLLFALSADPGLVRKPGFWAFSATGLGLAFLTTGSRSSLFYMFLQGLTLYGLRRRKLPIASLAVASLVGLVMLGALGEIRRSTWQQEATIEGLPETSIQRSVDGAVDELQARATSSSGALPILARVPRAVDHLYGDSYLAVLTLPIPRALWREKPRLVGGRVGRTFFRVDAGVPPGMVGEGFWNFGIFGSLFAFFCLAFLQRAIVAEYLRWDGQPGATVLYVLTLLNFREFTSSGVAAWLIALVPAVLILFVTSRRLTSATALSPTRINRPS